jgi:opacity protein-like surface antigen
MTNPVIKLLLFSLLWVLSFFSFAQESYYQFNARSEVNKYLDVGIGFDLEYKFKNHKHFTFDFSYNYFKDQVRVGIQGQYNYFKDELHYYYIRSSWFPYSLKNQPMSLFYITGGVGYGEKKYNKNLVAYGPAYTIGVGAQYTLFNRLTLGVSYNLDGFKNLMSKSKDVGFNLFYLNLGFRFFK